MSEFKNIKIADLVLNNGQIDGLPKNPRFIRNERFEALKKSISDAPEMLDYRRLLVYPFGGKYVTIAGNMRLRACKELGYKEMPCYVLLETTEPKKLREYAIKDNIGFGNDDTDLLANEWDSEELAEWGYELPEWQTADDVNIDDLFEENQTEQENKIEIKVILPEELENYKSEIQGIIKEAIKGYDGIKVQ